jgi:hypothetical protein
MIREFNFFLEAWVFCYNHNINWQKAIRKKDWNTWTVDYEPKVPKKVT